jgi:hypothetical protein
MVMKRISLALIALVASTAATDADVIDLRLDVTYTGANPSAGGSWKLFARSDRNGIFSLRAPLTGIASSVTNELPRGRVNSSASDNAGFSTFVNLNLGTARELFFAQQVTPSGAGQQGVFYGVGTLDNGAPNYPGRPVGTTFLGPSITTLASVQDVPWAASEDNLWATGVTVASGTFAAGSTPNFSSSVGQFEGSLLTTIGSISTPGDTTLAVAFTTLVRTNLGFGVATGDYNADGLVNAADYTRWRDTLNQSVPPLTGADGNGDGLITAADRNVWALNYGASAPSSAFALAVPEPAAGALLSVALGLLAAGRRATPSRATHAGLSVATNP